MTLFCFVKDSIIGGFSGLFFFFSCNETKLCFPRWGFLHLSILKYIHPYLPVNPADTVSPPTYECSSCELSKMQMCSHTPSHVSSCVWCALPLHASSASPLYFAYGSVYSTVVEEYFYFKSRMPRSKCKSSGYVAGTSKKCQAMERKVKTFERV